MTKKIPHSLLPLIKMSSVGNTIGIIPSAYRHLTPQHIRLVGQNFDVDQMMVLGHPMTIWNRDGSQAMACGNGTRCVGAYLGHERSILPGPLGPLCVIKECHGLWAVDQGRVVVGETCDLTAYGLTETGVRVNVGNDHLVILTETFDSFAELAPILSRHSMVPDGVNVSFCHPQTLAVRVWERGAGETMGCGSAACAIASVLLLQESTRGCVRLTMPGGVIEVERCHGGHWVHRATVQFLAYAWMDPWEFKDMQSMLSY